MSILSLADLKQDLQITDSSIDSYLQNLLDSAEATVEKYIETKFFVSELTELEYTTPFSKIIVPDTKPIVEVVSVNVGGNLIDNDYFIVYPCYIRFLMDYSATNQVVLKYKAGYIGVPNSLKQAIFLLVNYWLKLKSAPKPQVAIDKRIPEDIQDILDLHRCINI